MFGYVTPLASTLSKDENARYEEVYCGLCRELGKSCGTLARFALSYDMTFLVLLLSSLYEPEELRSSGRCVPHPIAKRMYVQSEIIPYAADISVILTYQKLLDDVQDGDVPASRTMAKLLEKPYAASSERQQKKADFIGDALKRMYAAEKNDPYSPDLPMNIFGELLGEIFVFRFDRWSGTMRRSGEALGRTIYMMDDFCDAERDVRRGRRNIFEDKPTDVKNAEELIGIMLGECTTALERLPLVRDIGIIRNILYSGIWTKFEIQRAKLIKREGRRGDGSI